MTDVGVVRIVRGLGVMTLSVSGSPRISYRDRIFYLPYIPIK
jgi:hypothetical protein